MSPDLRYALRTLGRNRAFTAVAVLSLALGIGANTAIFSLLDTVMLRTLPVRDPGRLVELLMLYPTDPRLNMFTLDSFHSLRDRNRSLTGLIANSMAPVTLAGERLDGEFVDGTYFAMLGLKPAAGRLLGPQDDRPGAPLAAVVSWTYWKSRLSLNPAVVGKPITLEGQPAILVGVAPKGFSGIVSEYRSGIWIPLAAAPALFHLQRPPGASLTGRLKPGVSLAQAQAELAVLYRQSIDPAVIRRDPNWSRVKFELEPASAGLSRGVPAGARIRDTYAGPLQFLMAVVGVLLLIACTNIASLLLARGAARQREMALRIALGAGRFRLLRQALTESVLLSVAGALGGVWVAYIGVRLLLRILATGRSAVDLIVEPDWRVLLFTAAVAVLTGILFGLAPALRAMAADPANALRSGGRAGETRLGRLFGKGLVMAQVVLSVVLLSGAGLFLQHLSELRNLNLGFRRDHVLLVSLNPARAGYSGERLSNVFHELLDRLSALPGVRSATLSGATPISGGAASRFVTVDGYQPKAVEQRAYVNWVAPRYFATYGTPLLAGREFTFEDQNASHVAIVNQSLVRYYFGDANPLGRQVRLERDERPFEIVGVVGDAKYTDLHEPAPRTVYLPAFQENGVTSNRVALRTAADPAAAAGEVRRAVSEVMKGVPADGMTTLSAQLDASLVPERLMAGLSTVFGGLGLLLAAIGLYGLLAYTVARRTGEIGIRMALGASRGKVSRMVLADALRLSAAGILTGVPLALWGRKLAAGLIAGLPAANAAVAVGGALAMVAVALAAAYLPARRAARVDPMAALRCE